MKVEPLDMSHVMSLRDVQAYGFVNGEVSPQMAASLQEAGGFAVVDDGAVLGIGGVVELWAGVGLGWAMLAKGWRRRARDITNAVKLYLDTCPYHRVEVGVRCDFDAGHRWARRLGFDLECERMRAWGPDREDYALYARVKEWHR